MKKQKLKVDYILFKEAGQFVAYSPQLEVCFNAPCKRDVVRDLKTAFDLKIQFWKDRGKILREQIQSLALSKFATREQEEKMQRETLIPYWILRRKHSIGKIFTEVEVNA